MVNNRDEKLPVWPVFAPSEIKLSFEVLLWVIVIGWF